MMKDLIKRYDRILTGFLPTVVILLVPLMMVVGLSGCGGDGDEPPDYKSLLKEASRYVGDMEQKNAKLAAKLKDLTGKLEGETGVDETGAKTDDEAFDLLMAENQTLMEEKEALSAEIAELKSKEDQTVTKKIAGLEAKNKSLSGKKAVYEEEIAKLRKNVKENEGLAESVKALEETNGKLTEQKASLEKEIADLRSELGKAEQLAQKLETLESENKTLSDLNKAIKSRMADIQKIMSEDQQSKTSRKNKK